VLDLPFQPVAHLVFAGVEKFHGRGSIRDVRNNKKAECMGMVNGAVPVLNKNYDG
jgi:hypothetical protein